MTTDAIKRRCYEVHEALTGIDKNMSWLHSEVSKISKLPNYANFTGMLSGTRPLTIERAKAISIVLAQVSGDQYNLGFLFPEILEMSTIGELQSASLSNKTITLAPPDNARSILMQPQGCAIRFTTDGSLPLREARNRKPHGRILLNLAEKTLPVTDGMKLKVQPVEANTFGTLMYEWRSC